MTNEKRLYSFPAKLTFSILATDEGEAKEIVLALQTNLNRFEDLSLVKGELDAKD